MSALNLDYMKRIIAVITDTHFGSPYAPFPDKAVWTAEGNNLSKMVNEGQSDLLSSWKNFLGVCDDFNVDTVIHLGDITQGCNPKEGGRSTMSPDLEVQLDAAEVMMAPLVKGRIYHQTNGTMYHESRDTKIHRRIVKILEPLCKEAHFHGPVANLRLRGTKKVLNAAHAATHALIYPSTMLDRERIFLKLAEANDKLPRIHVMVRGHLHFYFHLDYADMHILQIPGWMAWFPYRDMVRLYGKMQPDIGGVILLIDEQDRLVPLHFLYPCPHIIDKIKEG